MKFLKVTQNKSNFIFAINLALKKCYLILSFLLLLIKGYGQINTDDPNPAQIISINLPNISSGKLKIDNKVKNTDIEFNYAFEHNQSHYVVGNRYTLKKTLGIVMNHYNHFSNSLILLKLDSNLALIQSIELPIFTVGDKFEYRIQGIKNVGNKLFVNYQYFDKKTKRIMHMLYSYDLENNNSKKINLTSVDKEVPAYLENDYNLQDSNLTFDLYIRNNNEDNFQLTEKITIHSGLETKENIKITPQSKLILSKIICKNGKLTYTLIQENKKFQIIASQYGQTKIFHLTISDDCEFHNLQIDSSESQLYIVYNIKDEILVTQLNVNGLNISENKVRKYSLVELEKSAYFENVKKFYPKLTSYNFSKVTNIYNKSFQLKKIYFDVSTESVVIFHELQYKFETTETSISSPTPTKKTYFGNGPIVVSMIFSKFKTKNIEFNIRTPYNVAPYQVVRIFKSATNKFNILTDFWNYELSIPELEAKNYSVQLHNPDNWRIYQKFIPSKNGFYQIENYEKSELIVTFYKKTP